MSESDLTSIFYVTKRAVFMLMEIILKPVQISSCKSRAIDDWFKSKSFRLLQENF